jgi:hypothetical protein
MNRTVAAHVATPSQGEEKTTKYLKKKDLFASFGHCWTLEKFRTFKIDPLCHLAGSQTMFTSRDRDWQEVREMCNEHNDVV